MKSITKEQAFKKLEDTARRALDQELDREQHLHPIWHPGRLRRGVPIVGGILSPERREAVRIFLRPLMDENQNIGKVEREELESLYMTLPRKVIRSYENCYNCSPQLFAAARQSYRERNIFLVIADGHIVAGSDGIVARFPDDQAAIACLTEAGYTREPTQNPIFKP